MAFIDCCVALNYGNITNDTNDFKCSTFDLELWIKQLQNSDVLSYGYWLVLELFMECHITTGYQPLVVDIPKKHKPNKY